MPCMTNFRHRNQEEKAIRSEKHAHHRTFCTQSERPYAPRQRAVRLLAWLSARQQNGEFLLRIEDLDEMRCPRSFADLIIDDLRWLGLDWDGEIPYQSGAHGCL